MGSKFVTGSGQPATVRRVTGNDVWVDVIEEGGHTGTYRFSLIAVETALGGTPTAHNGQAPAGAAAASSPVHVGATFVTGTGQAATVRRVTGSDVWVDVIEEGGHTGTYRFSLTAVETALGHQ